MTDITEGEKKIIRALYRLEKLWQQYGDNLLLFNGNSLRKGGRSQKYEIDAFNIRGDGLNSDRFLEVTILGNILGMEKFGLLIFWCSLECSLRKSWKSLFIKNVL